MNCHKIWIDWIMSRVLDACLWENLILCTPIICVWLANGHTEPLLFLIVDGQTICPKLLRPLARLSVICTVEIETGTVWVYKPLPCFQQCVWNCSVGWLLSWWTIVLRVRSVFGAIQISIPYIDFWLVTLYCILWSRSCVAARREMRWRIWMIFISW